MRTIYIITGEASGDILASRLMRALRERGAVQFHGVGGETMTSEASAAADAPQALGSRAVGCSFESLFPMSDLSVMGVWEVLPRLRLILRRVREVVADISEKKPDVIVTVDSWGFVTQVLKKLLPNKTPKVHYVAPQVWAWKAGRARQTAQLVDRLMTLWPNEPPLFEKYGLQSDFVGHPVIENTQFDDVVERIPGQICVLPGSRHSEVKRLAPIFRQVVERLRAERPSLEFVIPVVDAMADEVSRAFAGIPFTMVHGQAARYQAFRESAFAIAASGTVSLELAACGAPHLIAYTFSSLTNRMVKAVVRTPYANIINILSGREVIPEFVLGNCRADLIHAGAVRLLDSAALREEQLAAASTVLSMLKPEGMMPSEKAASIVWSMN